MRVVLLGASTIAVITADLLLKRGHEVVIIERNKEKIQELSDHLDCGYLHGDGSKPDLLKEADPQGTDLLFCLTDHDQVNIITSLVGKSLGFQRVIVKIEDPQFEHICMELGLTDTIIPARMTGRFLADMAQGQDLLELSAMIKDEARVFSFVVTEDAEKTIDGLELPDETRVICLYRNNTFVLPDAETLLKPHDEVVIITHSKNLPDLNKRWGTHVSRK